MILEEMNKKNFFLRFSHLPQFNYVSMMMMRKKDGGSAGRGQTRHSLPLKASQRLSKSASSAKPSFNRVLLKKLRTLSSTAILRVLSPEETGVFHADPKTTN